MNKNPKRKATKIWKYDNIDKIPQVTALKEYIFSAPATNGLPECSQEYGYVVFLSICDKKTRATVVHGKDETFEAAWKKAEKKAIKAARKNKCETVWAKADIATSFEKISIADLKAEVAACKDKYFFRKGIAFDEGFETAFLESEINCNKILSYKKKELDLDNTNRYLKTHCRENGLTDIPGDVITFTTAGFFCDENELVYDLYSSGPDCGRRVIDIVDDKISETIIKNASEYLLNMIRPDGSFIYGFKPVSNNEIKDYNILRHTGSIWSLINYYRMTRDEGIVPKLNSTINYLLDTAILYKDTNTAYVVEHKANEVKLGGNGLAVIMLTEYMDVFKTDKYIDIIRFLANGILEQQNQDSGKYYHVLNYPDLTGKEEFRTIYYDGEATFALTRAYTFTHEQVYLDGAVRAVENFITNDYTKYRDHWVAYSLNEITQYVPEQRYFEFAMRNITNNFDKIYYRQTAGPTFLELLMAGWQTYKRWRITATGRGEHLDESDVERFAQTIYKRVFHMLNGYFYPEFAMYMKNPDKVLDTFFIREDAGRIRIDDIQHHIGGYYFYATYYDEIRQYLSEEFLSGIHGGNGN